MKQQQISELNRKMEKGIQKASDELADQLNDIRALKQFVKQTREQITDQQLQKQYVGQSRANQRRAERFNAEKARMSSYARNAKFRRCVPNKKQNGTFGP